MHGVGSGGGRLDDVPSYAMRPIFAQISPHEMMPNRIFVAGFSAEVCLDLRNTILKFILSHDI